MSVEVLLKNICKSTGEGPHWDETSQSLLYVDINVGGIHRWNSRTGVDELHQFDQSVSFIVPCRKGGYLVGLGQTISHFDWATKKVTVLHKVDDGKDTRFNDGKCDASGRLWCGTMGGEKVPAQPEPCQGSLYCLDLDGSVRKQKGEVTISNGLAWTGDNQTMYYIDSTPRNVYAYDYDGSTGNLSNEKVIVDYKDPGSFPDGMAIDTEGTLWIAFYGAARIARFDPNTGKEMTSVAIPAKRVTSCCFGGKNFDELYVTCSRHGASDAEMAEFPLAGSVFRVTGLGVKGKPAPFYEGYIYK